MYLLFLKILQHTFVADHELGVGTFGEVEFLKPEPLLQPSQTLEQPQNESIRVVSF